MARFYDDFERANGSLGSNWVTIGGTPTINSGAVGGPGNWSAYTNQISENGRQEASLHFFYSGATAIYTGPLVKQTGGGSTGYWCGFASVSTNPTLHIRSGGSGAGGSIASVVLGYNPGPWVKLALTWELGHLAAYVNDRLALEVDNASYTAGSYIGMGGSTLVANVTDFQAIGGSALQLDVAPDPVGNFGSPVAMTATGTNTEWTPGTPGAPLLTVNNGTITGQVVLDATHMTFNYNPGTFLGYAIFTDPSTGATDLVTVSSNPGVVPVPGSVAFTPQAVTMVNNTAGDSWLEKLTKPNTPVHVSAFAELELETVLGTIGLNTGATVDPDVGSHAPLTEDLYARLWGGEPWQSISFVPPGEGSVKLDTADAVSRLEALITANHWTLGDVIVQLAGEGVKTHLDLWNAIAALDGGTSVDLTSVLDAIAAARGLDAPSIRTVADLLGDLSTAAGYNLGDVHGWIAGIPEADLSTVSAKLALMQPSTAYNLSTVAAQAASLITAVTAIKVELDEVRALVEGLEIPAAGGAVAPLWPGEANVTLGASQALSNGLVVDGPMHGILLTITGHPAHNTRYAFGAVSSWARVGQVVFRSDRGDYERSQSFSMDAQVMVPATMEAAEAVTVRLNEGWTGTVRAWSRA